MKKRGNWKVLLFSIIIVYLVAFIGSIFTAPNTKTAWYESIKPFITPPNWVFPIVWSVLFLLIALSLYFAWIDSKNQKAKNKIAVVFGINFFLNISWSVLYFGLKDLTLAFFEIILLWASILLMLSVVKKTSKKSFWILIPYLLWVAFAGLLNYLSVFR